ncbi:hypothetical protein CBL_12918 [Carabus blaptoides fortunei]
MLTTILNNSPAPKCVVIQDSLTLCGTNILLSIMRTHLALRKHRVHFILFENSPERVRNSLPSHNLLVYDCISDNNGWLNNDTNADKFTELLATNELKGIVVIDSIAHVILEYGIGRTYRVLHELLSQKDVIQVLTSLHEDTVLNKHEILNYFNHISTLYMTLTPGENNTARVQYQYKKSGAKIIKQTEEYFFTNNLLQTKSLEKINVTALLPNTTPDKLPENMSTFRISLDENERKSREQLTLPYTKQANITEYGSGGGNVIYNLDDIDDWDEEDPDDDLDI